MGASAKATVFVFVSSLATLWVNCGAWDPYAVPHLQTAEFRVPDVLDLNIGADLRRSDVVIVYLVWHPT